MPTPILPCPFCGVTAKVYSCIHDDGEVVAYVSCENGRCHAKPLVLDSNKVDAFKTAKAAEAAAIKRWNRRK